MSKNILVGDKVKVVRLLEGVSAVGGEDNANLILGSTGEVCYTNAIANPQDKYNIVVKFDNEVLNKLGYRYWNEEELEVVTKSDVSIEKYTFFEVLEKLQEGQRAVLLDKGQKVSATKEVIKTGHSVYFDEKDMGILKEWESKRPITIAKIPGKTVPSTWIIVNQ